ncbi:putative ribonuclease H-like domain-containing protein [Tanacetum coccineum]
MQKAVLKQQFKRDSFYQDQGVGKKEHKQNCFLTMDDGVVNWGEHTEVEETNHALMAISSSNEVTLCSKTCIDSYNTLKLLCDEQMNQLGDQEAKILVYNQAVKKLEAQLVTFQKQQLSLNEKLTFQANEIYEKDEKLKRYRRIGMKAVKEKEQLQKTLDSWKDSSKNLWRLIDSGMSSNSKVGLGFEIQSNNEVLSYEEEMNFSVFNCSKEDSIGKPLYSRFTKTNDFKGVPHPLSGDYTPKPQEEIDDSLYVYGKKGPQKPEISVSDDNSSEHSTCQSNDSEGSCGNTSEHSFETESESLSVPNEMSKSRLEIKETHKVNRKNWNDMMERELGRELRTNINSVRPKVNAVSSNVNTVRSRQPVPNKTSNSFSPKRPQMNQINQRRDFSKSHSSVRRPFAKTTAQMSHSNAVMGNWGSADHPLKNMVDRGIFDSGCSGHMTGNKDQLEDFEEFNRGSVTFGGSKGYISGKGKIRVDNGTEFKNRDMLEFYGNKGIKQEYSNARTPQQNGVAERMNRTLIEAARTMLADSLLPTTFWAEAVSTACYIFNRLRTPQQNGVAERMNRTLIEAARTMLADSLLPTTFWAEAVSTACYIFNRVRVTKPQNKTPYELLFGHKPIISYIRPFGCHVTILDTLSVLGKFDGKSDEGFLVGYSLNSKAYRVYNLVTKRVEVNLHVNFLEDKPNVKGVGYRWMFDIDYLIDSMNYIPISLENQANPHAGTSEKTNNAGTSQTLKSNASEEKDEDVELIVVPSAVTIPEEIVDSRTSSTKSKKEKILTDPQQEEKVSSTDTLEDNPKIQAFRRELEQIALKHLGTVPENYSTSTPSVNIGSQTVNTGRLDHDDSPMPELEIFYKSET